MIKSFAGEYCVMISLADIQRAANLLHGRIVRTPLVYSHTFSGMTGMQVYLKLENLQLGGSFKVRGATFKIISHLDDIKSRGGDRSLSRQSCPGGRPCRARCWRACHHYHARLGLNSQAAGDQRLRCKA
jgi:Pyridoxal-phosphate dependent enzyme